LRLPPDFHCQCTGAVAEMALAALREPSFYLKREAIFPDNDGRKTYIKPCTDTVERTCFAF
jgi:hypothetical protein